eukprot:g36692.t1
MLIEYRDAACLSVWCNKEMPAIKTSLQGSLAAQFFDMMRNTPEEEVMKASTAFSSRCLAYRKIANHPDLAFNQKGDVLEIGLISEKGKYPPNW